MRLEFQRWKLLILTSVRVAARRRRLISSVIMISWVKSSVSCTRRHATHFSRAPHVLELVRCLTDISGTRTEVAPQLYSGGDPPWGPAAARNRSLWTFLIMTSASIYNKKVLLLTLPRSSFPDTVFRKLSLFLYRTIIPGGLGHLERANLDHWTVFHIVKYKSDWLGLVSGFIDHLCTHDSELQEITAPPVISTIHPAVSSLAVYWQRLLTMESLQLHALRTCLHSLPCRSA
jgi:hypothetical protein